LGSLDSMATRYALLLRNVVLVCEKPSEVPGSGRHNVGTPEPPEWR
jgi:hypothetical protein